MPVNTRDSIPPPVIGKIGPYTVFMTPPSTPKPSGPALDSPRSPVQAPQPPVQPPPQQFEKPVLAHSLQDGSISGFFKGAALGCRMENEGGKDKEVSDAKLQNV